MGFLIVIILIIIGISVYRKSVRENHNLELVNTVEALKSDPYNDAIAIDIVLTITNLKNVSVQLLRQDLNFYLVFRDGTIYYETRWLDDSTCSIKRNTQCLYDRLAEGKNPLTSIENEALCQIVYERLKNVYWLCASNYGTEIKVEKSPNASIPEA